MVMSRKVPYKHSILIKSLTLYNPLPIFLPNRVFLELKKCMYGCYCVQVVLDARLLSSQRLGTTLTMRALLYFFSQCTVETECIGRPIPFDVYNIKTVTVETQACVDMVQCDVYIRKPKFNIYFSLLFKRIKMII